MTNAKYLPPQMGPRVIQDSTITKLAIHVKVLVFAYYSVKTTANLSYELSDSIST